MEYKGLKLDRFQEEAIHFIEQNHSVVVSAPTGAGKTLIADYIINRDLKKGIKVVYTAPIKALSNQKYKEFTEEYGKEKIGLLTGDIVRNPAAPVRIMTTEVYRNMVLSGDPEVADVSYVVLDEVHYINDIERGRVWEESIIFSRPNVRFLCLSATIPNADEFARWIKAIKGHETDVVRHHVRHVPLHKAFYDYDLGITSLEGIKKSTQVPHYRRGRRMRWPRTRPPSHVGLVEEIKDKLPCFFFTFSRANCQKNALELAETRMFKLNKEVVSYMWKKLEGTTPEINRLKSTRALRQALPYGVGFHHAGLMPIIKELVEELFGQGMINVLYTTETFAVGINMPAKTACFDSLRKFDGINFRFLNSKEYFQIAGRAGRRGIDKEGFAYAMIDRRDFDYYRIKKMTDKDVDPIVSQFRLSVNTVLNLIKQHDEEEISQILRKSFFSFQKYGADFSKCPGMHSTFNKIRKILSGLGYIDGNSLTCKGEFSSRIYTDEITVGEIFATGFYKGLDAFQILLLLACIVYEPRESTMFHKAYPLKSVTDLRRAIREHPYLSRNLKFRAMGKLTALVYPCFEGGTVFDAMRNTNLLEGDVIRFFRQMLDLIGQIKKATTERDLLGVMDSCQQVISESMKDIDII